MPDQQFPGVDFLEGLHQSHMIEQKAAEQATRYGITALGNQVNMAQVGRWLIRNRLESDWREGDEKAQLIEQEWSATTHIDIRGDIYDIPLYDANVTGDSPKEQVMWLLQERTELRRIMMALEPVLDLLR